jgi:preprotein translocase subunit YajC
VLLLNLLFLQSPAAAPAGPSNLIGGALPILLMIGIFYLLLFLPMQRQRKAQQKMIRELQAGSTVLTTGGIIGTITELRDDSLVVRVKPDGVKLELARSAVSSVVPVEGREVKK